MTRPQDALPVLDVCGVARRFGRRLLFRELSFSLSGGECLAVTGVNGSGKSTLLRILAGVMLPTAGTISLRVNGTGLAQEAHPLHAGLVAPYVNVYAGFSPRENLRFIARARRLENEEQRIEETLASVGLARRMHDRVSTFSSGMVQRVKLAAALLADPPLLLLDEPNEHLDEEGRRMMSAVIEDRLRAGAIVVVATNDEREAKQYARTLCVEEYR